MIDIGPWDLTLLVAVSLLATCMAYVHNPRHKALLYVLPVPFTLASMALDMPVGTTHVLGLPLLLLYTHAARWLHLHARMPVVAAIVTAAAGYCFIACTAVRFAPDAGSVFWLVVVCNVALAATLHRRTPHRQEPGYRSPLPMFVKLPVVMCVVALVVLLKQAMQGFMVFFPMMGVVAVYESRHSLWTLNRQLPIFILAMSALLTVCRLTQARVGLAAALALGWVAFLCVLLPLTRRMWRQSSSSSAVL